MKVLITNVQRFCLHDGPGIRTTVFFKGCNLRCPWCANPENISFNKQSYKTVIDGEKIEGCYGYEIELEDLEKEILLDKTYYEVSGGGVTFSGGEPLLQLENLKPLLENLKKKNIHMCIETALMVDEELLSLADEFIDEFFIDIKILQKDECKEILNGDIDKYYNNLNKIFKSTKKVTFRIPIIPEYTFSEQNIKNILKLLKKYKADKIEIFKIHSLAEKKYKVLGKDMLQFKEVEDTELQSFYEEIKKINNNVNIIKI